METINLVDLLSKVPKVKYSAARNLLAISAENPAVAYPDLDYFIKLLDSENNILNWTAIEVIGHVAKVDKEKRIDPLVPRLIGMLNKGKLITANHAVSALSEIALVKPEYQAKITAALLKVEDYKYETDECRNIVCGQAILAVGKYLAQLEERQEVIEFVQRQAKSSRNATRKKAEQFLRRAKADI